jgi:hypothetical protein
MSSFMSIAQWDQQINEKEERERMQRQEQQQRAAQKKADNEREFREKFGDHWYSREIDAWVPVGRYGHPSLDRVNSSGIFEYDLTSVEQSGFQTAVAPGPNMVPYTLEEYHERYCTYDEDKKRWNLR